MKTHRCNGWRVAAVVVLGAGVGGGLVSAQEAPVAEVVAKVTPAQAAQSLRLDLLLGDAARVRPTDIEGPVWTLTPGTGRELVVLPVGLDMDVEGVTLDAPAFSVQSARFLGWVLPEADAADVDVALGDAAFLNLSNLLTGEDVALDGADAVAGGEVLGEEPKADDVLEGAPRMARALELTSGGRLAWDIGRSMPGEVQAVSSPPTAADAFRLKLAPEQLRALKPERPERPAREAGEDRRAHDRRVREVNIVFKEESGAFRALQKLVREQLPERFEIKRPGVVWAVYEANASASEMVLRGHAAGRWSVTKADFDVLVRLAGGQSLRGASVLGADAGLTAEQVKDVASLNRVAATAHPWSGRAAAAALTRSGYLSAVGLGDDDLVGQVARRLLASPDKVVRNRVVYALVMLNPMTPGAAALLEEAAATAGEVAMDIAAVRARLAAARRGDVDDAGGVNGAARGVATMDLAAAGRVVGAANQMLQNPDGPDAGVVVRELLAATEDATVAARGSAVSDVDAALIGGLKFSGLAAPRFNRAATAVLAGAGERPVLAGGWLNRELLGSADRQEVERTLDLLASLAVSEPAPVVGALARRLRKWVLRPQAVVDGEANEAAMPQAERVYLTGGLPLNSANHAMFRLLNSGDADLRKRGWRAMRFFELPALPVKGAGAKDKPEDDLLTVILDAALSRVDTPDSLVPFLVKQSVKQSAGQSARQPASPLNDPRIAAALVRVTAHGDVRASRRAARALLGGAYDVAAVLKTLDANARARFGTRLYDRLTGSLAPVTGLLREESGRMAAFLGTALAQDKLPTSEQWAQAAGEETVLYEWATGDDDGLAHGAVAGLAAKAGADGAHQLGAIAAMEEQRRVLGADDFAQQWAHVRRAIYTSRLAAAAGPYRLVVTLKGLAPVAAEGGGLAKDAVLGSDPEVIKAASASGADGEAPHEERLVLGVVELVADGGKVRLGGGTPEISVPNDVLAIRVVSPGDLKNLPVDELQDLPLERIDGAMDLLPDGHGGWRGMAELADGRTFELHMAAIAPRD